MARDPRPDLTHWHPRDMVDEARSLSLPDFLLSYEAAFMLVVMLDAADQELAFGLAANSVKRNDTDGLAFRTATRDLSATVTGDAACSRAAGLRPSFAVTEQSSQRLPGGLSRALCHVVPICKRSEVSFLHHVSIGRARNHDIVLRHKSVSKFHAWLEISPDVRLFVKDCDSSNHTFINGERVIDRAEVKPGDTLKFGSVESRVCTSEGLWKLLRG